MPEKGQVHPRPLLSASSELGVVGHPTSTMCAACWQQRETVLKCHLGEKGVACGRTWSGFPCSFRSTFGGLTGISVSLDPPVRMGQVQKWPRKEPSLTVRSLILTWMDRHLHLQAMLGQNSIGWTTSDEWPGSRMGWVWLIRQDSRHGHDCVSSLVNKRCIILLTRKA